MQVFVLFAYVTKDSGAIIWTELLKCWKVEHVKSLWHILFLLKSSEHPPALYAAFDLHNFEKVL